MSGMRVLVITGTCSLLLASCAKKKEATDLTPMNAADRYADVMIKTKKKAEALDAVLPLKQLIDAFHAQEGRYPSSLQELAEKGYVKELPRPPRRMQFVYNPSDGSLSVR